MLLVPLLTAMSIFPSPLKSPVATDNGPTAPPRFRRIGAPNAPPPRPGRMLALFEPLFGVITSGRPSPSMSATASSTGSWEPAPVLKLPNVERPAPEPAFLFAAILDGAVHHAFTNRARKIERTQNKIDGTANSREHRSPLLVVGRAMQTREENFE